MLPVHRPQWTTLLTTAGAATTGILIALVDSGPNWDDTGITVSALLIASGIAGLVKPRHAWRWAMLVGGWTPLIEITRNGSYGALAALAFAFVGTYIGSGLASLRVVNRGTS